MTEEITIEEIKRLDAEKSLLEGGQVDYRNMVKELAAYCQPLELGGIEGLGKRHSTNLIADHKRQAEELQQLRAENERLRGALEWYADNQSYDYVGDSKHAVTPVHCDMGFRAKEALAQSPAPAKEDQTNGGWLSIESAPKIDRNRVWLWDGKYVFEGSYRADGDRWVDTEEYRTVTPIYWQHKIPQPPINDKQGD